MPKTILPDGSPDPTVSLEEDSAPFHIVSEALHEPYATAPPVERVPISVPVMVRLFIWLSAALFFAGAFFIIFFHGGQLF